MKELFQTLAKYNAQTNSEMIELLEKLSTEQIARDAHSYYGSILGILNHILVSDVNWLRRFCSQFPELDVIASKLPAFTLKGRKEIIWSSLATLKPIRSVVDENILKAFQLIPEGRFNSVIEYRDLQGKNQQKTAWIAFIHIFNHQTHHRGQIALILDQLSIENDYSNIIWKF
jgi:uncharacterized damage-inducible protein DinB